VLQSLNISVYISSNLCRQSFLQVAAATSCEAMAPERLKSLQKIPYNTKKFALTPQNLLIRAKFCGKFWHVSRNNRKAWWFACAISLYTFNL